MTLPFTFDDKPPFPIPSGAFAYVCPACNGWAAYSAGMLRVRNWMDDRFLPVTKLFMFCGNCSHLMVVDGNGNARNLNKSEVQRIGEDAQAMAAWQDRVDYLCRSEMKGFG
jgi:hypothetical protein